MNRYKKLLWLLLALNVVALCVGFGLRTRKLQQEDKKFVRVATKYAEAYAADGSMSVAEGIEAERLLDSVIRDRKISDKDLDWFISLMDRSLVNDPQAITFGALSGIYRGLGNAPEPQKRKMGELFLRVANHTTLDRKKVYALKLIGGLDIRSARPGVVPFCQHPNPEVSALAKQLVARFAE